MTDFLARLLMPRRTFAPEGEGGTTTAEAATAEAATADAGTTDTAATEAATTETTEATPWWKESFLSDDDRKYLEAKGLTVDDWKEALPKVIQGHRNAEKRLGAPADQFVQKPGKDQSVADWMKGNREMFGIPEAADKYEIARPEGFASDDAWDAKFEATAREVGFEHGIPQGAMNALVGAYAERVKSLMGDAETDLQAQSAAMTEALERDWGEQTPARMAQARQGAQTLAEAAKLDDAAMQNLSMVLKDKVGDANVIRLFQAAGQMMGEDKAEGLGKGSAGFGMTPADARAELQRLRSPGGEFYQASETSNMAELKRLGPKMEQLTKLAAT